MSIPFSNPGNFPSPIIASIDKGAKLKAAIVRFRLSDVLGNFGSAGPLNKPYLTLNGTESVRFAVNQLSLGNNFPDFGTIRSLGYTFRPNFHTLAGSDTDYYQPNTLTVVTPTCKVIAHDLQTSSTAHIETDETPYINSDQGSSIGFYLPSDVVVQGVIPFYGSPFDTIEVCALTPSGPTAFGHCELRFYNFDVPVFNRTSYSNFVKLA
jgi:hypothetical protein